MIGTFIIAVIEGIMFFVVRLLLVEWLEQYKQRGEGRTDENHDVPPIIDPDDDENDDDQWDPIPQADENEETPGLTSETGHVRNEPASSMARSDSPTPNGSVMEDNSQ